MREMSGMRVGVRECGRTCETDDEGVEDNGVLVRMALLQ